MIHTTVRRTARFVATLCSLFTLGCTGGGDASDAAARQTDSAKASIPSRVMMTDTVFKTPESVRYDADLDVFFVSNINGNPSQKDGNGFISRMRWDGSVDSLKFIAGGRNGVVLNAPKGMAIAGDTLWVADVDQVRAFDKRTGAPIASVDLSKMRALFLNDVVIGPEGDLYITDTGIRFASDGSMSHPTRDKIFRISGRTPSIVIESDTLGRPNGITWDTQNTRFVLAPFGAADVQTWKPGDAAPASLVAGPGQYDGVELLADGRLLVSSWADSAVHVVENGAERKFISGVPAPADFGIDTKRNRVAIPLFQGNRVEIWEIGG